MSSTIPIVTENDKNLLQNFVSIPEKACEFKQTMESFLRQLTEKSCFLHPHRKPSKLKFTERLSAVPMTYRGLPTTVQSLNQ